MCQRCIMTGTDVNSCSYTSTRGWSWLFQSYRCRPFLSPVNKLALSLSLTLSLPHPLTSYVKCILFTPQTMFFQLSLIFLLRYASPANTNNNLQNVKVDWLNGRRNTSVAPIKHNILLTYTNRWFAYGKNTSFTKSGQTTWSVHAYGSSTHWNGFIFIFTHRQCHIYNRSNRKF